MFVDNRGHEGKRDDRLHRHLHPSNRNVDNSSIDASMLDTTSPPRLLAGRLLWCNGCNYFNDNNRTVGCYVV
jgi:hypothetical protein